MSIQARQPRSRRERRRQSLGGELDQKLSEIKELQGALKQKDAKLAEAQKTQADLLRKQRELDDAKRELDEYQKFQKMKLDSVSTTGRSE